MRQLKRNCRRQRRLAEAMVRKRSAIKPRPAVGQRKTGFTQSIVSAIGVTAIIGMGPVAWGQEATEGSAVVEEKTEGTPVLPKDSPALPEDAPVPPKDSPALSEDLPALPEVVVPGKQEKGSYKPEAPASPKYTEPLVDIPQTITVIPQAVIEERGATTLRDVLRNVPGISMQAGEGGVPAGDNLSIRGFNARTDIFIDGVRDFGGYSRDPFNTQQVEVSKGPASSYAGRGSTGGSINMVSKTPALIPFYQASLGGGTDDYKRFSLDFNQPMRGIGLDGAAFRLNALWHDADVPGRDVVTEERWGVAPSIAFGLNTPTRLTLSYFHLTQDNIAGYGLPWVPRGTVPNTDPRLQNYTNQAPPVTFSNFYGPKNRDYEHVFTDVATGEIEHDFNPNIGVRNLFRYGRTRRDSVITAPRFVDSDPGAPVVYGTTINRQIQSRDQTDQIFANLTDVTLRFRTWAVEHTVVTGFEYDYETSVNYLRAGPPSTTDLFNPNPNDPSPGPVTRTGARNESRANSYAFYGFDTIKFGEHFEVVGGLRWEYFDVNYNQYAITGALTPLGRSDEMLSWRAGVVYKPLSNGSVYAAAGTSFNPSAEGLTLSSAINNAANLNTPPEESRTIEVGTKWNVLEDRLLLTLAFFRTEKTNARTEDPTDPTDVITITGKERVDGVEISAAGSITDEWQVFGGYVFMDSEIVESQDAAKVGTDLPYTPDNTFNLWTTYRLPWDIELGAGAQFVDSRLNNTAPPNTRTAPSYWLYDAMIEYYASKNLTLRLNGYNLADEKYIEAPSGGHFIPGAGRSVVATANFTF